MPAVISVFTHLQSSFKTDSNLDNQKDIVFCFLFFLLFLLKGFNEKQNFEIVGCCCFLIKNHLLFGIKCKCIMKH